MNLNLSLATRCACLVIRRFLYLPILASLRSALRQADIAFARSSLVTFIIP